MFKQRLITALILIPLVLASIFFASHWFLGLMITLLVGLAGWEWAQLIPIHSKVGKLFYVLLLLACVGLCSYLSSYSLVWLDTGLVIWSLILLAVISFPTSQKLWGYRVLVGIAGLILLPLFENTFAYVYLQMQGKSLIVYLLCLVWATDTGAYVAGKWGGRYKLIPKVSPGKTWEGALGGFVLAMIVATLGYWYFHPVSALIWFMMNIGTILISMLGDLFISMLKRRTQLKDTGRIFPGHGGLLDRIDSLIAALPLFYFGLMFL